MDTDDNILNILANIVLTVACFSPYQQHCSYNNTNKRS